MRDRLQATRDNFDATASALHIGKVREATEFKHVALHFACCMTALCTFSNMNPEAVKEEYPKLEIVLGTHVRLDRKKLRDEIRELLRPSASPRRDGTNLITAGR